MAEARPWRNYGYFNITRLSAERQARRAAQMHKAAGLGPVPTHVYRSEWRPWALCAAEAFALAGVGVAP